MRPRLSYHSVKHSRCSRLCEVNAFTTCPPSFLLVMLMCNTHTPAHPPLGIQSYCAQSPTTHNVVERCKLAGRSSNRMARVRKGGDISVLKYSSEFLDSSCLRHGPLLGKHKGYLMTLRTRLWARLVSDVLEIKLVYCVFEPSFSKVELGSSKQGSHTIFEHNPGRRSHC